MIKFIVVLVLYLSQYCVLNYCSCGTSYIYNSDSNSCVKPPASNQVGYVEGCNSYSVSGITQLYWRCIQCKPSYRFKNGQCLDMGIEGCSYGYKQKGTNQYKCIQCDSSDYYLQGNSCKKFPTKGDKDYILGCEIYIHRNKCIQCKQGYLNTDYYCKKIEKQIPNCIIYKNTEQCQQCQQGYVLNTKDNCINVGDVIKNCQKSTFTSYGSDTTCNECNPGYYLDEKLNKCISNPTTTRDGNIPNCISYYLYEGTLKCNKCDTKYSLKDSSSCQKIQGQTIENCDSFKTNAIGYQQCSQCQKGYTPYESNSIIIECNKCPVIPGQKNLQETQEEGLYEFLQNTISDIINKLF